MSTHCLQEYLRTNGTEALQREFSINVAEHPELPLVALKYSQLDSPKLHHIVRECRGIVLERNTLEVVAKPFRRFFNAGEDLETEKRFDWSNCTATDKCDGSLVICYHYRGDWHVNTSGSFGLSECGHSGKSWREVFWETSKIDRNALVPDWTYLFELCTPFNRVVRVYPEPCVFLIGVIRTCDGEEMPHDGIAFIARLLGVESPQIYRFTSLPEIETFLKDVESRDKTFEGVVVRDSNNERMKVKTSTYVALHHLFDNGNVLNPKRIVPLVLAGECDEVLGYFPRAKPYFDEVSATLATEYATLEATWELCRQIESQKEFALAVLPRTKFSSILFAIRKNGNSLASEWRNSSDLICRKLYGSHAEAAGMVAA